MKNGQVWQMLLGLPGHIADFGITGGGKTYLAKGYAERWQGPVLFINTMREKMPFLEANKGHSRMVILRTLAAGRKVSYVPDLMDDKGALSEVSILVNSVMSYNWPGPGLLLVADESHEFAPLGKPERLVKIAKLGRHYNIKGFFITQAPADLSKGIVKMCDSKIIFRCDEWDAAYYRRYRLPQEEIERRLKEGGEYSFVVLSRGELTGPWKV